MEDGYIKLYRQLLDSIVFAHPLGLKVWIWCLLKANFKQRHVPLKVGKGVTTISVQGGQFIFGRFKAEEETGIDGSTIYKWMQKLQELDMIKLDSNNQYTVVTICNWDIYQQETNNKEQPKNNCVTAEEHLCNTNKKDKKEKNYKNKLLSELKSSDFDDPTFFEITVSFYELFKTNLTEKGISTEKLKKSKGVWIDSIRMLIEIDKYTVGDIRDVFRLLQNDDFWKTNILSTSKLREKFDKLLLKARTNGQNKSNSKTGATVTDLAEITAKHFGNNDIQRRVNTAKLD